jgi:hypothetical protein
MKDPVQTLEAGRLLLDPALSSHGFIWTRGKTGASSGGSFACGEYTRENRRLELHFRHSLGLVTYHVARQSIDHSSYMRVLLGPVGGNHYPGFSNDPLDAFRHLAHDLTTYCSAFLTGSDDEFESLVRKALESSNESGFKRLP